MIQEETFPAALKISKVIPLHKAGDQNQTDNYRPIAIIPTVSKVFEKALDKRMRHFLETYSILSDKQYGYRSKRSAIDAVMHLVEKIRCENVTNSNHPMQSTLLDLSKAFDTLNHSLLLGKFDHIGFGGSFNKLLSSYNM